MNDQEQKQWQAQRKKARKTAIILAVVALGIAVWSVMLVIKEANG